MKRVNEPWHAAEIAAICAGYYDGADFQAWAVSTDTRTLNAGDLFVALHGANFRGEDFVAQAQQKGAVAAVVAVKQPVPLPQIVVADPLQALTALAAERRARSEAKFIAITGSNGKTSTKEMLQAILRQRGATLATHGNLNNDIGVPLTLLRLRAEDRFAVIEIGANHCGEIRPLTTLVQPDIALVTNYSAAHLAGFGSLHGVMTTKKEIYDASTGALVMNGDLPVAKAWQTEYRGREMAIFSLHDPTATAFATDINPDGRGFVLHLAGAAVPIAWQLQGQHNVANALAAAAAAHLVGATAEDVQRALTGFVLQKSRLSAYTIGAHTLIDDTYNANPASFAAAIAVLRHKPRPVLIAGAMGELGDDAPLFHRQVAENALANGVQLWAVGDGLAREYAIAPEVLLFPDTTAAGEALQKIFATSTPHTIVVKGSRSARMERVFTAAGISDWIKKG